MLQTQNPRNSVGVTFFNNYIVKVNFVVIYIVMPGYIPGIPEQMVHVYVANTV